MARKKTKGTELSVFKGREAKLNRAVFQILAKKEPQTTRELHKKITKIKSVKGTSYSTLNKRVRNLEEVGFLKKALVKERRGGITNFYELRPKAYLAMFLASIRMEDLVERASDENIFAIIAILIDSVISCVD